MKSETMALTRVGKNECPMQEPEMRADETITEIRSYHKLLVISEDFFGEECVLADTKDKTAFMIGRSPECDIQLDDKRISRHHAVIFMDKNECILRDHRSVHGTFVNDLSIIPSKRLHHNDVIRIVDTVFMFIHKDKFVLKRNIKKIGKRDRVPRNIRILRTILYILLIFILILFFFLKLSTCS